MQRDIVAMVLQYPLAAAITRKPRDAREWYAPRLTIIEIRIGTISERTPDSIPLGTFGNGGIQLLLFRVCRMAVCGWSCQEFRD